MTTWTKRRKVVAGVLGSVALYAATAVVIQLGAPMPPPELTPQPGDVLVSRVERVEQTILRVEGDKLFNELVLLPGAAGPPVHYHESFDELFTVMEGTLQIVTPDGAERTLHVGDVHNFAAGTLHRPFNTSSERTVVHGAIPTVFATCLSQFYGFLDAQPGNAEGIKPLLQLSLMRGYCDTHVAPKAVEVVLFGAFAPIATVLGYRSFYPEYAPARTPRTTVATTP